MGSFTRDRRSSLLAVAVIAALLFAYRYWSFRREMRRPEKMYIGQLGQLGGMPRTPARWLPFSR